MTTLRCCHTQIDYALKNSQEKLKYLKDILKDTERVDKNKKK